MKQKYCPLSTLLALAIVCLFSGPSSSAQFKDARAGVPEWEVDPEFKHDVFTFARVKYTSTAGGYGWGRRNGRWATDYPDAELNLAYRLQQMTSLKVNPDSVVVTLDQDDLSNYPFLYIVEPGRLMFQESEITALRNHLLNGGFLMVDDFWGEDEWDNFHYQIKRVFPNHDIVDLDIDHPIFHTVFDIKELPQVPSINWAVSNQGSGRTWERDGSEQVHFRGIFDNKGRMMAIICHNTDLGDGWEKEGDSEWYFREFAEKKAYPMGINIIFYAMTH